MKLTSYFTGQCKNPQTKHGACPYMRVIKIWFSALTVHVCQINLIKVWSCHKRNSEIKLMLILLHRGKYNIQMKIGHGFRLAESSQVEGNKVDVWFLEEGVFNGEIFSGQKRLALLPFLYHQTLISLSAECSLTLCLEHANSLIT